MKQRSEGDTGALSLAAGIGVVSLAPIFTFFMTPLRIGAVTLLLVMVAIPIVTAMRQRGTSNFPAPRAEGMGTALLVGGMVLALQFVLLGIALVLLRLPQMAVDGLRPPGWLVDYHWSKPSLMIMAFWGAVGSNNMLLYLAGLSNVPKELYESAEIDGASGVKKFWHVTWPQLAPVTMFIVIMSVIYGLQGGFEMARTMTAGGPAGATTTLSYYVYNEGFETGRLAYAAAISWVIFALVFVLTLITWKFENRYVTD
ncbi:sugar ABC transporter permease [bacterium]|nr:sugar ABC transporter permease [bacterium]